MLITDKEPISERGSPRSHSESVSEPGLNPRFLTPNEPLFLVYADGNYHWLSVSQGQTPC